MSKLQWNGWLVTLLIFSVSCSPFQTKESAQNKKFNPEVIYGEDARRDFYAMEDAHWQELSQSTVALIDHRDMIASVESPDHYDLKTRVYGQRFHLCKDEAFYDQPSVSFCSGFLIGATTLVTAGHCMRNQYNCENVRFTFNYKLRQADAYPYQVAKEDVFYCDHIIHTETNGITGRDFAIIRLDRAVTDHPPLPLRAGGRISEGEELSVIGYPSGLPLKFSDEGVIRNNDNPHFFVTNLDTYGGNSGSAVFNSRTRLVEGILVRGETDFVYDPDSACRRSKVCLPNGCRGEDVVRISTIYDYITPQDLMPPPDNPNQP
jgi:hypothetical protein